jgi:hypothetical protein
MQRSPIGPCVRINWNFSTEFVPVHPEIEVLPKFETVEHWNELGKWFRYHPRVTISHTASNICYKIAYVREDHPELNDFDISWGITTITIDNVSKKVRAYWKGNDNSDNDGWAQRASLVAQAERGRTNARPTIRNQSQLRKLLLDTDQVCAVTREPTPAVLECAHIVSVENGGFEIDRNAILLRADLHCLFDSGCFDISPKGKVVKVSKKLNEYYRNLLKEKKLDEKLTSRVTASLVKRQSGSRGPVEA